MIESGQVWSLDRAATDLSDRSDPVLRAFGRHLAHVAEVLDLVARCDSGDSGIEDAHQAIWLLLPPPVMAESLVSDARELAALLGRVVRTEDALKEEP